MTDNRHTFVPDERPEPREVLYLSFEKKEVDNSNPKWILGLSDGQNYTKTEIPYRNYNRLADAIDQHRVQYDLRSDFEVYSVHECGRTGHSLRRELTERGIKSLPIDPASPDGKKNKPGKTDRLDAKKLVRLLVHYIEGDHEVFSVVNTPSRQVEDDRELARERNTLKDEQRSHKNRIRSLLFKHGINRGVDAKLLDDLDGMTTSTGHPLGKNLKRRIRREMQRLKLVQEQLKEVSKEMQETVKERKEEPRMRKVIDLYHLKSFGFESSYELVTEAFGWREFQNRGEVTCFIGLDDVPWESSKKETNEGISKQGPGRLRALSVQLAWSWVRHQPDSELTQWFHGRVEDSESGDLSDRKKRFIVALARKLMNRVRRYLEYGEFPNGAVRKTNPSITF